MAFVNFFSRSKSEKDLNKRKRNMQGRYDRARSLSPERSDENAEGREYRIPIDERTNMPEYGKYSAILQAIVEREVRRYHETRLPETIRNPVFSEEPRGQGSDLIRQYAGAAAQDFSLRPVPIDAGYGNGQRRDEHINRAVSPTHRQSERNWTPIGQVEEPTLGEIRGLERLMFKYESEAEEARTARTKQQPRRASEETNQRATVRTEGNGKNNEGRPFLELRAQSQALGYELTSTNRTPIGFQRRTTKITRESQPAREIPAVVQTAPLGANNSATPFLDLYTQARALGLRLVPEETAPTAPNQTETRVGCTAQPPQPAPIAAHQC